MLKEPSKPEVCDICKVKDAKGGTIGVPHSSQVFKVCTAAACVIEARKRVWLIMNPTVNQQGEK